MLSSLGAFFFGLLDDFAELIPCGVAWLKPFLWAEYAVHHTHGYDLVPRGVIRGRCRCADPSVGCGLEVRKGVRSHIRSDWKKIFLSGVHSVETVVRLYGCPSFPCPPCMLKDEVNGCHGPRRHPDTLNGVFFKKKYRFFVFFWFFSPKMLFFCIPMTSNVFPRAINMFFKGS